MKYSPKKKAVMQIIIVIVSLVLLFGAIGISMNLPKLLHKPKTLASLEFQQFEPKFLPAGVKVTGKDLIASVDRHSELQSLTLYVSLNLPKYSHISEERTGGLEMDCKGHIMDDSEVCVIKKTPKGQQYMHVRNQHKDGRKGEDVRFVRDGTLIAVRVDVEKTGFFSEVEWQNTIDSFVPVKYDLKPEYEAPGI
jgi:hypothetical protein